MDAIITPPGEQTGESANTRIPSDAHERAFDALTRIAGYVCDAPFAAIVLDDGGRMRVASMHGLSVAHDSVLSFCAAVSADFDEIYDTLASERLRGHVLVAQPPCIRGFSKVELKTAAGHSIGALLVMDRAPRRFTPTMKLVLRQLGVIAARLIEAHGRELIEPPAAAEARGIDPLTGLTDLKSFEQRAQRLLGGGSARLHALLYIDLDQFGLVEEKAGKAAGDELLRQAAKSFAAVVRHGDTLGYLGSDKFGVLLANCPHAQALRIAHQLVETMRDFRFAHGGETFVVGASIGVVGFGDSHQEVAALIEAGYATCRAAKNQGRNRVQLAAAAGTDATDADTDWVTLITASLQDERVYLTYQRILPVFAPEPGAEDEEFFEVLLRLGHEGGEAMPTGDLLAKAQRYGLMPLIDRWVVRTLFDSLGSYYRELVVKDAMPRRFAVNISAASIADPAFLEFVIAQFRTSGAPHRAICFDIQETVALANLDRARHFVLELKELGCRFALDDFGSGLTSFNYLRTLPVDYLKIDGGYVKTVAEDSLSEAMIKAITDIAHLLGMKTIAESVENDDILDKLRLIGVDYIQGYGIHMPAPFDGPNARPTLPKQ
jgi:diguanylate cyclase (GGDEF)-like protein